MLIPGRAADRSVQDRGAARPQRPATAPAAVAESAAQSSATSGTPGAVGAVHQRPTSTSSGARGELAEETEHRGRLERVGHHPADDHGSTGAGAKTSDATTPKLPPPPRIAQKRSAFVIVGRTTAPSARTRSADEVVGGQAVFPSASPAHPRACSPPTPVIDTRRRSSPGQNSGLAVEVAPERSALDVRRARLGVDVDAAHQRQVDQHASPAMAPPRRVVAAAPHRHLQPHGPRSGRHQRCRPCRGRLPIAAAVCRRVRCRRGAPRRSRRRRAR